MKQRQKLRAEYLVVIHSLSHTKMHCSHFSSKSEFTELKLGLETGGLVSCAVLRSAWTVTPTNKAFSLALVTGQPMASGVF